MKFLDEQKDLRYWLPALAGGLFVWLIFLTVGETPVVRASGLALVIAGVMMTLRQWGALLALTGGLAMAFTPVFWQQTGGTAATPATIVLALVAATVIAGVAIALSRRPYVAVVLALTVFAGVFFTQIGVARSLRLTALLSAWLIFLLVKALMLTNPRPDEPPPAVLPARYRAAILLALVVGVINDPLFALFIPAVTLGLSQSNTRIPVYYWGIMIGVVAVGLYGIFTEYYHPVIWTYESQNAANFPYLIADGWRNSLRWVELFGLIIQQFTALGFVLGIIGMSRLARWYPVVGVVLMLAYAAFFAFGLMYFGTDRQILILPLFFIQVIWMTYAVHAFSQWFEKSFSGRNAQFMRWFAPAVYVTLPVVLLVDILFP